MSNQSNQGVISQRFPNYGWAWPCGSTEQLLRAAGLSDETVAKKLFVEWMQTHDIDDVTWAEQRLLLAIAARFSQEDVEVDNRPRLNGLVRVFWTKSRLSLRAAEPVVGKLAQAGIELLVFKGAARAAKKAETLKGRVANDVDILVRPEQFKAAIIILGKEGWQASNGRSIRHCCSVAEGITGLNFFKDDFGDIDLHQSALHDLGKDRSSDRGIWERSCEVPFLGTLLRIPDATDELVIAIAHGGIDGHVHSDWVIDCNSRISSGQIDWDLFLKLVYQLKLVSHAAIVLSFLRQRLDADIPTNIIEEIISKGHSPRFTYLAALFQARPICDHSAISDLGRSFFKQRRLRHSRSQAKKSYKSKPLVVKMQCHIEQQKEKIIDGVEEVGFEIPANASAVLLEFYTRLHPQKRRYEFELNEASRHVACLTIKRSGGDGICLLKAKVPLDAQNRPLKSCKLVLQSRPWRLLRPGHSAKDVATYGKVPFELKSVSFVIDD